jgi:glycosyltransferase involved in cell wall biosynthesis
MKILLVAYYFPPDTEVGGIRVAKFAKFLPEFGHQPYVLTIQEGYIPCQDAGRLKDVIHVPIVRASVWPTLRRVVSQVRRIILEKLGVKRAVDLSRKIDPAPDVGRSSVSALTYHLRRLLISLSELPDRAIGWLLPAVWNGYRLIRKERIDLILATCPPVTGGLIGLCLSKLTSARLVLDLRDPLLLHEAKSRSVRTKASDQIERWLETWLIHSASRVISATEQYTRYLRHRFPGLPPERFCTIWNGYDSGDFPSPPSSESINGRFVVSYLGTFYFGRTPRQFLQAIGELVREGVLSRANIQIHFVGDVRQPEGIPIEELVRPTGLDGCVVIQDIVPYSESLSQMQKSVVLLLFAPEQYYSIPAKAFEYLYARRWILCLAKDGATADLIRGTGTGTVVDPYDVPAIKRAIQDLYVRWEFGTSLIPEADVRPFERRELVRMLSHAITG